MDSTADPSAPVILVVEDEPAQMEMLQYNLINNGYSVACTDDGEEAVLMVEELSPDLVLLDWMLPGLSGLEVCRQIRRRKEFAQIPVLMLTARGEEADRVRGLDMGADDYVIKPYSVRELLARVRATLRRTRPGSTGGVLEHAGIQLDIDSHRVTRADTKIDLGPTEFRLLTTLLERPGRVWSREQLLARVWGIENDIDTRTVDVHIGRLRKSLCVKGTKDPVRTVRGFGYAFDAVDD